MMYIYCMYYENSGNLADTASSNAVNASVNNIESGGYAYMSTQQSL